MAKFPTQELKTPIGELNWVFIDKDGKDKEKDNPTKGKVKTITMHFHKDSKEAKQLIDTINKTWQEYKAFNPSIKSAQEPKSLGYKAVKDKETGAVTDILAFGFSTNSFWPDGNPNVIKIFNPKGEDVTSAMEQSGTKIGNGSKGIVFGSMGGYEYQGSYGISLYLNAVQLAKLVKYSGAEVETEDISAGEEDDGMGDLTSSIPEAQNDTAGTPEV